MYDYQKDLKNIVDKAVAKYGDKDKAIFEMNGVIASLKGDVSGKDTLLEIASNKIKKAINTLKSMDT